MSIQVITPGALTTVQDLGRIGYQAFGVPVSGAMDPRALRLANILCGNPENEAALECTLLGPALRFTADNVIGLTGGDLGATLDGQPLAPYGAYAVKSGQTLRFTAPKTGCRAYLAFHGGLDIPPVMGSRSTYLKAKLGGFCGRKLEKDDEIAFRAPTATIPNLDARRFTPEFVKRDIYTLRVVLGPQDDAFTAEGLKTFLSEVYTVTPEFDRMGCLRNCPQGRRRHHLGRHCLRRDSGSGLRRAHHHARGPADHRRLHKDCKRNQRGFPPACAD
mgnify:CR=1 FL=1